MSPVPRASERRVRAPARLVKGQAYILVRTDTSGDDTSSTSGKFGCSFAARVSLVIARFVSRRLARGSVGKRAEFRLLSAPELVHVPLVTVDESSHFGDDGPSTRSWKRGGRGRQENKSCWRSRRAA